MIVALLAAAAVQTPPPASPDEVPDEVVVIGQRLKGWTGRIVSNPLFTHCRTTRSTGDAEIDRIGCTAMTACWPAAKPELSTAADRHRDAVERDRLRAEVEKTFGACSREKRDTLIVGLVERRHSVQAGSR